MNILVKLIMSLFATLAIYSSSSYKPNASETTVSEISDGEFTFEETYSYYYYDSYYYIYEGKVFNNTKNEYFISSLSVKATLTYTGGESVLNEILDIDYLPAHNYAEFELRFQLSEPVETTDFTVSITPTKFVGYTDYTPITIDDQNLVLTKTKRLSVIKNNEENKITTTLRTYIDNNFESKYIFYYGYVTFKDKTQYFVADYPSSYDLYIDLEFTFDSELTDDEIKTIEESIKQNFVAIEFLNQNTTTTKSYSGLDSLSVFVIFFFIAQIVIALFIVLIIVLVNRKKKGK